MSKTIAIVEYQDEDTNQLVRGLQIDDEVFDWGIDLESFKTSSHFASEDAATYRGVVGNILKHFVNSFAEFVGNRYSLKEIIHAINTGILEDKESICT